MRQNLIIFVVGLLLVSLVTTSSYSEENRKLAQTSFQFLSVVSDARGVAMAEAMTSLQTGSSALFFNPAGMASINGMIDITASNNQWIADITHNTFSMAVSPFNGQYGVLGVSVQTVDYGEFYGTRVDKSSDLGYQDTEVFELAAASVGIGYAKQLTDRFAVGGQIRRVVQDLGESEIPLSYNQEDSTYLTGMVNNKLSPFAFDFGTQFHTGYKSLVFGMSVRNFCKEIKYVDEGFQLPLVFNLGISMNLMDFMAAAPLDQSLMLSIDASHFRSHPEQVKIGLDYQVMRLLSLRSGYISNNDESGLSYGFGVNHFGIAFDYSYTPFGIFDNVQRMTIRFQL